MKRAREQVRTPTRRAVKRDRSLGRAKNVFGNVSTSDKWDSPSNTEVLHPRVFLKDTMNRTGEK